MDHMLRVEIEEMVRFLAEKGLERSKARGYLFRKPLEKGMGAAQNFMQQVHSTVQCPKTSIISLCPHFAHGSFPVIVPILVRDAPDKVGFPPGYMKGPNLPGQPSK